MKPYIHNELGFQVDIPDDWPRPTTLASDSLAFICAPVETVNFVVGPLGPERLLRYTEAEFHAYAQANGFTDLEFGRISAGGASHVWARYSTGRNMWLKKYMVVFPPMEYDITASCYGHDMLVKREPTWDRVVRSFRLCDWRQQGLDYINTNRVRQAGVLYAQAYEAVAREQYAEACELLEQCLKEDPDHVLAHKELAFVLKNTGNARGALTHRLAVKRLDPSDQVNLFNLAGVFALLGETEQAMREVDELLAKEPRNRRFLALKRALEEKLNHG